MKKMTAEQAGQIALPLVQYMAGIRESIQVDADLEALAKQAARFANVPVELVNHFIAAEIIPACLEQSMAVTPNISVDPLALRDRERIALAYLQALTRKKGCSIGHSLPKEARSIARVSDLDEKEVVAFMVQFLVPVAMQRFLGIKEWSVVTE